MERQDIREFDRRLREICRELQRIADELEKMNDARARTKNIDYSEGNHCSVEQKDITKNDENRKEN